MTLQLENDMENYMRWKMMGGFIRLKKGVVPHIFDCQSFGETKSLSRRRIRCGRRKREKVDVKLNKDASYKAMPLEWVDCGAGDLSNNSECLPEAN